jgi:asparagine synthase (glutamine-hydrolysing)
VLRTLLDRLVPPAMVPAQKLGFTVPMDDWLRGPLAPLVEDTLFAGDDLWPAGAFDRPALRQVWADHCAGRQRTVLLWGLLCLQWWHGRMARW